MGVTRKVVKEGNGTDKPAKGDVVVIDYTGNLYDESKGANNDYRGKQYVVLLHLQQQLETDRPVLDSIRPKVAEISRQLSAWERSSEVYDIIIMAGTHKAINLPQGWDEGVMEMSLGERSILTITGYVSSECPHVV